MALPRGARLTDVAFAALVASGGRGGVCSAVVVVMCFPPPLAGHSRAALERHLSGPQGRHDVVALHVLRAGRDGAQVSESGPHLGRTAQQHILGVVCFLPADRTEGCRAMLVLALGADSGRGLSDPATSLGRAGPVAGPRWWTSTAVALFPPATGRGRREPISRWYHPAGQAQVVCVRAGLAAARWTVLTSTAASVWLRELVSLAMSSALSFPSRLQWDGTHWRCT